MYATLQVTARSYGNDERRKEWEDNGNLFFICAVTRPLCVQRVCD